LGHDGVCGSEDNGRLVEFKWGGRVGVGKGTKGTQGTGFSRPYRGLETFGGGPTVETVVYCRVPLRGWGGEWLDFIVGYCRAAVRGWSDGSFSKFASLSLVTSTPTR
jgi:hypothetical protein